MRTYSVTLTGRTPLLMHRDNIEWADHLEDWKNDPDNKKLSRAGDDRTPAWRWLGSVYHDGQTVGIPQENLMRCFMEGGAMVLVPGGKSGKTFKAQTQSGMFSAAQFWPLKVNGEEVPWSAIEALKDEPDFRSHIQAARQLGFDLLAKRAKVGMSKHIRVRPIFRSWELTGELLVWDEQITDQVLDHILTNAGQYKGIGDWRPGGRTPGPYGTFDAEIVAA